MHDLVYFTPEARQEADRAGMRGFWMGWGTGRFRMCRSVCECARACTGSWSCSAHVIWRALMSVAARTVLPAADQA
ncbi:hypothetical protein [Streptomyces sp. CA-106110]|uniref:hypothetical protein n=1 Tax=Streptomyces sp. CA-106110 TaxID=3240044 RepID=UPI003D948259